MIPIYDPEEIQEMNAPRPVPPDPAESFLQDFHDEILDKYGIRFLFRVKINERPGRFRP